MYIRFTVCDEQCLPYVRRLKAIPANDAFSEVEGLCHGLILELAPGAKSAQFSLTDKGGMSVKMHQVDFDRRLLDKQIDVVTMLTDWVAAVTLSPLRIDASDTAMISAQVRHQCLLALDQALLAATV